MYEGGKGERNDSGADRLSLTDTGAKLKKSGEQSGISPKPRRSEGNRSVRTTALEDPPAVSALKRSDWPSGSLALPLLLYSPPSLAPLLPLRQELRLFHGWEVVICYRRPGSQRGLGVIWTGDQQENHIRRKACLNMAVIAAIVSRCLFIPHLPL